MERVGVELAAGGDAEFGVGLVEVVADGAWAEEELGGDVAVGQPPGGEPGDLQLLRGQPGQVCPARRRHPRGHGRPRTAPSGQAGCPQPQPEPGSGPQ